MPTYLQGRVARGQPLPRVEASRLRSSVGFLLGIGGAPEGKAMPERAFRVVMDLLMPSWDPLRAGVGVLQV